MFRSFKYRLYPTQTQERLLAHTLECCRRWYNDCLAERKTAWEERGESIGKLAQLRQVKKLKATNPDVALIHSHVLQTVVGDLDRAFAAFFRRVKAGDKPGYPRFKSRDRFDSFGYKQLGNGFKLDGRRLRLTFIGRLRVRWHRPIEGKIKIVRILRQAKKWYACFVCEVDAAPLPSTGRSVGVDVGIHHLMVTSDNETIDNPRWYRSEQATLRVLQRTVARRARGGANRRKAVEALTRHHERIANRRKDFLNKLTHALIERYDRIALEDLQITNLVGNRRLSKSILDAGWSYLKQRLMCKAEEAGREVVLVNPAYTSKTCSRCGTLFESLTLADRWVSCRCGLSLDRDHNAAINILNRAGHARWGITWPTEASVPQESPAK